MIECRFVYKFAKGGTSDTLNATHRVHAVPRVGETLFLTSAEGGAPASEVKEVAHFINQSTGAHEIVVYYGDKN